ncbi:MAG: ATP synthase F1 subunit delta [bacterium]|nr:ATP synthase F1 subunit delta [bacterium]MDT8395145.1 ATP synthase F1 subunit delta [bacterium]
MIGFVLAKRYAKAVIGLAQEAGSVTEVGQELEQISGLFAENPDLVNVFSDPTIAHKIKEKVLEEILRKGSIQELTMRFIHVLNEKNRILGIGEISRSYRDLSDQLTNRTRAMVVSASKLEDKEKDKIKEALSRISGKDVILEIEEDESLLGGVVAYMGSQVYDGSLKNQLALIKDSLSKGR